MKNYIVGYGSLINEESQRITGVVGHSVPIILKGYKRSWTVVYDHLQFCALGVYPEPQSEVNAVLFETHDLEGFDRREHGYHRVALDRSQIQAWSAQGQIPEDGDIWIYLPKEEKHGFASESYFIWQSYVDVILMGCLAVGSEYVEKFMSSTAHWNKEFFKDDRATSEYLKKLKTYDPDKIDHALKKFLK
jgi:hypothetical protein